MELKINLIAILIAVIVNFVIGFIWFGPLFGKTWGKEMGYDSNAKPEKSVLLKGVSFMIIGNFLLAWVFAHNIAAWDFVPGTKEAGALRNGIKSAVFTWLGFYLPSQLVATVWEKKSWMLFAINTGYSLLALLVVALILTHWK